MFRSAPCLFSDDFDDTEKEFIRGQVKAFKAGKEAEVEKVEAEMKIVEVSQEVEENKIEAENIFDEIMFGSIDQVVFCRIKLRP